MILPRTLSLCTKTIDCVLFASDEEPDTELVYNGNYLLFDQLYLKYQSSAIKYPLSLEEISDQKANNSTIKIEMASAPTYPSQSFDVVGNATYAYTGKCPQCNKPDPNGGNFRIYRYCSSSSERLLLLYDLLVLLVCYCYYSLLSFLPKLFLNHFLFRYIASSY